MKMAGLTKLAKASTIALREYMGLSDDETLLIISDANLRDIGLSLFEIGKQICSEAIYAEIKPRAINGEEPPNSIADLMKSVDVVVCPTTKSLTHTNARRAASKLGVRVGTMPGITAETMTRCLTADPTKIVQLSEAIAEKMKNKSMVHIETEAGTDLWLPIKDRNIIVSTGVLHNIGESGNLPSGEVYVAPVEGKAKGKLVIDGSMAGLGLLKSPISMEIEDGYAKNITGGNEAKLLQKMLDHVGDDAYAIGEFGIGTNHMAKLCGNILEDEKVLGTIHVALGNNLTMGGSISVKCHLDGLVTNPTVYFDDETIMKEGKMMV